MAEGQEQCWCLSWHLVEDWQEDRKPLSGIWLCAGSWGRGRWSIWILGQPNCPCPSRWSLHCLLHWGWGAASPSCSFGCIILAWEDLLIKTELVPLLFFPLDDFWLSQLFFPIFLLISRLSSSFNKGWRKYTEGLNPYLQPFGVPVGLFNLTFQRIWKLGLSAVSAAYSMCVLKLTCGTDEIHCSLSDKFILYSSDKMCGVLTTCFTTVTSIPNKWSLKDLFWQCFHCFPLLLALPWGLWTVSVGSSFVPLSCAGCHSLGC